MNAVWKGSQTILPSPRPGLHFLEVSVLADGGLALLTTEIDLTVEWQRGNDGRYLGDPWKAAANTRAQLWRFNGKSYAAGPCFTLELPFITGIDRFADGRWLTVGSRCKDEPNARILGPDGTVLARFMVGDGVGHAHADRSDRIWVGWFDEGVFGNEAWHLAGREWPPSADGIGLFSDDGTVLALPDLEHIASEFADCYALNVLDEEAWLSPYTDYPIVNLRPGQPARWWTTTISGAGALAVHNDHVLLAGGYRHNPRQMTLLALDDLGGGQAARIVAEWSLPSRAHPAKSRGLSTADRSWRNSILLSGRKDIIHLVQDGVWHRWRVSDAINAARQLPAPQQIGPLFP